MERGGEDDVLVATTKPKRGREMISSSIPGNVFARTPEVETYHEGFVDGKKILVPDSNLEAMKDMINLTMRQRKSTRYRHQTSADMGDEMTVERLDKILSKVKDLRLSDSTQASQTLSKGSFRSQGVSESELKNPTRPKTGSQSSSRAKESDSESESQWSLSTQESLSKTDEEPERSSFSKGERMSEPKNTTRPKRGSQGSSRSKEKGDTKSESHWSSSKEENMSKLHSERSSLSKGDRRSLWSSLIEESLSKLESDRSSWSKEEREFLPIVTSRPEAAIQRFPSLREESTDEDESEEQQSTSEEPDECHLRLLLSGHFKNNEKPIYIIQELNKSLKVFNKESADFTSSQQQGNVHVFITGKLFKENVLEESVGKPTCLNIKPYKILIDPNKSKIFRSYFESTYNKKETDITIKGEFLRNERSMDITPFLSLNFKQNSLKNDLNILENENCEVKRTSILSENTSNSKLSKGMKRVSFRESSDEEIHFIYKNQKKRKRSASFTKKTNTTIENKKNFRENPMEAIERKNEEGIFFFITHNKWFQNIFAKPAKDK